MRTMIAGLLLFFLLVAGVHAQNIENNTIQNLQVTFDIQPSLSVKQTMKFTFSDLITDKALNYSLGGKVRNVDIFDGEQRLQYDLIQKNDNYNLQIFLEKPTSELSISYVADDLIFQSASINHFFTELSFQNPVKTMRTQVMLPTGYGIYQNSYLPTGGNIISDGKRIILSWSDENVLEPVTFSVKFASINQGIDIWILAGIIILTASGVALAVLYIHFKRKTKEEFLKGFREDEQKVVQYLDLHKKALQNKLQEEFKFSRAKATRIVMKLMEKGLVKKQRFGRTNKLFWLKK